MKRFIEIEQLVAKYRLMYYYPEKVNQDWHKELTCSDEDYEKLEREYLDLCFNLNTPNYYVTKNTGYKNWDKVENLSSVQLDLNRPSVMRMLNKYSRSKDEFKIFCNNLEYRK